MGASSSFITDTKIDIYISYPSKTEYIERMIEILENMKFKVIDSSLMIKSRIDFSISEIRKYMEELIEKTEFIFICISKETIKSVTQVIEMNEIMDRYPTLQNKIVYFMIDTDYTPITNDELKTIVKKNVWYPIYDEDSLFYTTNKILTLLLNQSNTK